VKAVVEKIPGIETADYEVAEVEHTVEAPTKLFKGAEVVSNMVGPFIKLGPEVVEACPNGLRGMARSFVEQAAAMSGEDPVILVVLGAVHSFVRNHTILRRALIEDAKLLRRVRAETTQVLKIENIDLPAVTGRSPRKMATDSESVHRPHSEQE
jgi:hypothetical protein